MVFPSPFLDVIGMSLSTVSLLSQLDSKILCQQNAFLKTYDLNGFMPRSGCSALREVKLYQNKSQN